MDDASSFHMTIVLLQLLVLTIQVITLLLAFRAYHRMRDRAR